MREATLNLIKKGYSVEFMPDFNNELILITLSKQINGEYLRHSVKISMTAIDLANFDLIEITLREQEKNISDKILRITEGSQ